MICRNCANMFDDSLSSCPECGTSAIMEEEKPQTDKEKKSFVLNIPEEEIEKPIVITAVSSTVDEEKTDEKAEQQPKEKTAVKIKTRQVKTPAQSRSAAKEAPQKKQVKRPVKKESVGDRSAATLIVSIMCILACMMTVLTVVSVKSDVFKGDGDTVKTVALSSLSGEDAGSLEQWLVKVGALCDSEFNSSVNTVSELLSFIRPYDKAGLYGSFYGEAQLITDLPDPAHRYADENGSYAYYKLPEKEVDSIVESCCLTVNHTVNSEQCYYYNGFYYFADAQQYESQGSYIIDVKNGKRIQDGSYYVDCSMLQQSNLSKEPKERYLIVEKSDSGEAWKIKRISSEPVFDSGGMLNKADSEISYEMKTQIIEKSAKDGTVYHRYIIEYPLFSGETEGEKMANQLFSDTINTMSADDSSVQADYERFTKFGGNTTELPLITHVVSRVTYNKNGYISVLEEKAEYTPNSMPAENIEELLENGEYEPSEDTDAPVSLPVRTVEGYNFDVETGDFVTKDAIIGKEYQLISELLYRIYNGYGYDDIIAELEAESDEAQQDENLQEGTENEAQQDNTAYVTDEALKEEIPEDELGTGIKIYESASAICDKGYMFCYVTEKGYAKDVVIPFEIPNLFLIELTEEK